MHRRHGQKNSARSLSGLYPFGRFWRSYIVIMNVAPRSCGEIEALEC